MKNLRKVLVVIALIGIVVMAVISYGVYRAGMAPNTAFEEEESYVLVPTGTGFIELLSILEPVLKDIRTFEVWAEQKQYSINIKPGRFRLTRGMNNNDIVNELRSQNRPLRVAFNNQETMEHLAGRIGSEIEADSTELLEAFMDPEFLGANGLNRENALAICIPNTYELYWNTNAEQFRDRMFREYRKFWTDERKEKARLQGLTESEAYTLASVVQKETNMREERPRVAGVYLNRLRRGMLLQADPTVVFAIKKETGDYDTVIRRVLNRDLRIESPYNTYKYKGLPPGPIAMPDISSLQAVLSPESHDFLYFVADPSRPGYHLFGRNLSEHNHNKAMYIKWLNDQKINR